MSLIRIQVPKFKFETLSTSHWDPAVIWQPPCRRAMDKFTSRPAFNSWLLANSHFGQPTWVLDKSQQYVPLWTFQVMAVGNWQFCFINQQKELFHTTMRLRQQITFHIITKRNAATFQLVKHVFSGIGLLPVLCLFNRIPFNSFQCSLAAVLTTISHCQLLVRWRCV